MAKIVDSTRLARFWTKAKQYIDSHDVTYSEATTSAAGLMSAADKTKLNALPPSVTASTTDLTAGSSSLATGAIYLVYE